MRNTIYLRRKNKVIIPVGDAVCKPEYIATLNKNLEGLGYTLSGPLMERLLTQNMQDLEVFYLQLVKDLKEMVGANVAYKPMYPNFPKQVMEMSEAALYLNAMIHYYSVWVQDVTGNRYNPQGWLPAYEVEERMPLLDDIKLKIIDLGTEEEFVQICHNLLAANSSLSETDKSDIQWFLKEYTANIDEVLPQSIPQKETIAFLAAELLGLIKNAEAFLMPYFKTATDVLRLAVAMSAGDVSLATNTKFRNFKRPERRFLLTLLENAGNIIEDMLRYSGSWIRLGERLHPFEYKQLYPRVYEGFDTLRNDLPFATFNHKVEKALLENKPIEALNLLAARPGELARRLDHLLRLAEEKEQTTILTQFSTAAEKVSTPVLLQVMSHFKHRNAGNELRTFFPKGNVAKAQAIKNELQPLSEALCLEVVEACQAALVKRFKELPALGKIYLDNKLQNHLVPFSQRSASKALRTLVRGSRLNMPPGDTIRFFIWWKEGKINEKQETGRVDLDLSSILFDENWKYMEHISYTNLKSSNYKACHSGDITAAPNGACEFIDLDIPSILKYGGRFVIMNVYSFSSHPFCDLPECHAGWMMRQFPRSGEIFEAKTVADKVDLSSDTRICIPVILDLLERQLIWTDLGLKSHPSYQVNVEGNLSGVQLMGMSMTTLAKATLFELFELHVWARGEFVDTPAEADTVFSESEGITPFDIERIMAEFMT